MDVVPVTLYILRIDACCKIVDNTSGGFYPDVIHKI